MPVHIDHLRSRPHQRDRRPAVAVVTTDGTRWTWDDLVGEFAPALAAFARSRGIRDPDDVVQDVLVTAVTKLDTFEGDSDNLRSWLFTLAYRRVADRHRRHYRSRLVLVADHEPTPSDDPDASDAVVESEAVDDAMAAFDLLDQRQRMVLHLRIIDELSPRQVGERLGLRSGHVRVIQSRALAKVRRHLQDTRGPAERIASGLAIPVVALRDLRATLPSNDLVGAWVERIRAIARAPEAAAGAAASGAAAAAATAPTSMGSSVGSALTVGGEAVVATGLATKLTTTGIAVALTLGAGAVVVDRSDQPTPPAPASSEAPTPPPDPVDDLVVGVLPGGGPTADPVTPAGPDAQPTDPAPVDTQGPAAVVPTPTSMPSVEASEDPGARSGQATPAADQPAGDPTRSRDRDGVDDTAPDATTHPEPTVTEPFDEVTTTVDRATDSVDDTIDKVSEAVNDTVTGLTGVVDDVASRVTEPVDDRLGDTIDTVTDGIDDTVDGVTDGVDDTVDDLTDGVDDTVDDVTDAADEVTDALDDLVPDVGNLLGPGSDGGEATSAPAEQDTASGD